jgi:hypothetical protein
MPTKSKVLVVLLCLGALFTALHWRKEPEIVDLEQPEQLFPLVVTDSSVNVTTKHLHKQRHVDVDNVLIFHVGYVTAHLPVYTR